MQIMFPLYYQTQEKMNVFKATKDSDLDIFGYVLNFTRIITVAETSTNANEILKYFK